MRFTNSQKANGEIACRKLNKKAYDFYSGADPFNVYEYEVNGNKRYAYDGCCGNASDLTFDELEKELEGYADIN